MKNSADWLREIEDLYEGQKTGRIKPPQAVEMNNTIGKLISLTKLQLEHSKMLRSGGKDFALPQLESTREPAE